MSTAAWPAIEEPLLRERLAMGDDAFTAFMADTLGSLPPRTLTPALLATALGYPWERPARSFLLSGDRLELLDAMEPGARRTLLAGRATGPDGSPRYPLLAFGSNGAPARLALKLAHFPEPERRVLVLAGELHGFDVGAAAHPTAYGSMPATLFESPDAAVRAAILWVSAAQFTQLSWTEISYRLGRLDGVAFTPDQETGPIDGVFAYASRWGTFCPDGEPVALAAVPARSRTAPALSQRELLDRAARLMLGPDVAHDTLVRAIFEDMAGLSAQGSARMRAHSRPFTPPTWTPWSTEKHPKGSDPFAH